jgi:hypothetical protein
VRGGGDQPHGDQHGERRLRLRVRRQCRLAGELQHQHRSSTGQNLANAVNTATDASGNIKIHGGANSTDVVIDVHGYLV